MKCSLFWAKFRYVDEGLSEKYILVPEFRSLALDVARQSMVLLKNEDHVLPLEPGKQKVALIGPLANARADLLGTWAITGQAADVETVLYGFQQYNEDALIAYEAGCSISGDDDLDLSSAVATAEESDVVVLVVGESSGMSGEAHSCVYLGLSGRQQELVDAVAATGKPIITVLMCVRPLVIPGPVEKSDALLIVWHGGTRTG